MKIVVTVRSFTNFDRAAQNVLELFTGILDEKYRLV